MFLQHACHVCLSCQGSKLPGTCCCSDVYIMNPSLNKRDWALVFGGLSLLTVLLPSFHNYRWAPAGPQPWHPRVLLPGDSCHLVGRSLSDLPESANRSAHSDREWTNFTLKVADQFLHAIVPTHPGKGNDGPATHQQAQVKHPPSHCHLHIVSYPVLTSTCPGWGSVPLGKLSFAYFSM